jgi:quinol-cytochrome oxidoreductase complex cytochrome b subunit
MEKEKPYIDRYIREEYPQRPWFRWMLIMTVAGLIAMAMCS